MIRYIFDRYFGYISRWHILKIFKICDIGKFIDLGREYALAARSFESDSRSTYAGKEIYEGRSHILCITLGRYLITF